MGLRKGLLLQLVWLLMFHLPTISMVWANTYQNYIFILTEAPYTRLCKTKNILTVNGQYPGPTLRVHRGDTVIVKVINQSKYNATIHWHGVKLPRNPWSDGPEYVTQCPIQPGTTFVQEVAFSTEEGTLWWHAHSDWTRATVHGAIVIYPQKGSNYPFPKPYKEVIVILGEWWMRDVNDELGQILQLGGQPNSSDAYTINGQPGDLYPCSKPGTFRILVESGKTYLLRVINAAMNDELFFSIARHSMTVVGVDASYIKPLNTDYIMTTPGQTMDILVQANQPPSNLYYMAASAYSSGTGVFYDNTTTTAIFQYVVADPTSASSPPFLPSLPAANDTQRAANFTSRIRSLNDKNHPSIVPQKIDNHFLITVSIKTLPCGPGNSCQGPNGSRLAASVNDISFVNPSISILQSYHAGIKGVYDDHFPSKPLFLFNFTGDNLPLWLLTPKLATQVAVLEYNSTVEIVYQGTNLVAGEDHPMHLHGYSFYVVGWGFGNFDPKKDPANYNLVDPPLINTVGVPKNGWVAIRFRAGNPGVWLNHCHLERHLTWGMDMTFIVKNGPGPTDQIKPPPPDMPPC